MTTAEITPRQRRKSDPATLRRGARTAALLPGGGLPGDPVPAGGGRLADVGRGELRLAVGVAVVGLHPPDALGGGDGLVLQTLDVGADRDQGGVHRVADA